MARLILESGGERREYSVAGPLVLGRHASNAVVLEDRALSREHARIDGEAAPGGRTRFRLRDLGSKNGTFLNGKLIKQAELLKDGDEIRLGPFTLRFVSDEKPAAEIPSATRPAVNVPPPPKTPLPLRPLNPERIPSREESVSGRVAYGLFLLVVFAAGTVGSRLAFLWALNRILPR